MRSDVKGRRHVAAIGLTLAMTVLLAACTGSDTGHSATEPATGGVPVGSGAGTVTQASTRAPSAASGYDAAGLTWFTEAADVQAAAPEQQDTELGADPPGKLVGPEAAAGAADLSKPGSTGAAGPVPANRDTLKAIDVCGLVPLTDWRTWTGTSQASAVLTSPGEECVYLEPADQARLRVSVSPAVPRLLGDADRAKADKLAGLNADAYWLSRSPTPFGSTLVIELPAADIVLEVFDRSPAHGADEVRAAATRWASAAIGGMS